MAWAAIAGAGVGLLGSVMAGDAAEAQAEANRQAMQGQQGAQYQFGLNAQRQASGQLYGSGGLEYLRNTGGRANFDLQFGRGAFDFMNMSPEQQAEIRAGRQPAGAVNPNNDIAARFNAQYRPEYRGRVGDDGNHRYSVEELDQRRAEAFSRYFKQQTGKNLTAEEISAFRYNQQLPVAQNPDFDPTNMDAYQRQYGGQRGIIGEQQDQSTQAETEGQGILNNYDAASGRLNDLYQQTLGDYDTGTNTLMGQYQGMYNDQARRGSGLEAMASDWGRGAEESATADAQRALTGANQQAQGRLAASGLGNSTLVANQMSGNASESARNLANTKLAIQQGRLGAQMGARSQTNQTLGGISSAQTGAMGQRLTGRTGLQTDNINFQNQRSNARTGIEDANLNRNITLRQTPLNTRLAMLQSQIMNPGMNINTAQFYTPSGAGSTQSALGGFLGNMGGNIFGRSNYMNSGSGGQNNASTNYQNDPNYQGMMAYERR